MVIYWILIIRLCHDFKKPRPYISDNLHSAPARFYKELYDTRVESDILRKKIDRVKLEDTQEKIAKRISLLEDAYYRLQEDNKILEQRNKIYDEIIDNLQTSEYKTTRF